MSVDHKSWNRLGDGSLTTQDADQGLGHIIETKTVFKILAILIALTFITVGASHFNFGVFNLVVAILIASIKAGIVAGYFMHLKFEGKVIWMYVAYPIILIGLLIFGTLGDTVTREKAIPLYISPENLAKDYQQPIPKHAGVHPENSHNEASVSEESHH